MEGSLIDVFEISGRGCVVLVEIESGSVRVGDGLIVTGRTWPITGIEMVTYNAEGLRRLSEGWQPPTGILLGDAEKSDLIGAIGERVCSVPLVSANA
jgi:translation elongation factor EF-Tu-like GTPase